MGREIRQFFVIVMILLFSSAAQASMGKESLKGLKGVMVDVEEIASNIEKDGLKRNSIQTDVKKKLRKAGIKVLTKKEKQKTPGMPWLYVSISSGKISPRLYAYTMRLELIQSVALVRNTRILCNASTWKSSEKIGAVDETNVKSLRYSLLDLVDEFIFDYLFVNPKE